MWMNFLLRTLAWQTLLEKTGVINSVLRFLSLPTLDIINTDAAIILGMVYNFLPFMVLPIYTALTRIDYSLVEAALETVEQVSAPTLEEILAADHAAREAVRAHIQ